MNSSPLLPFCVAIEGMTAVNIQIADKQALLAAPSECGSSFAALMSALSAKPKLASGGDPLVMYEGSALNQILHAGDAGAAVCPECGTSFASLVAALSPTPKLTSAENSLIMDKTSPLMQALHASDALVPASAKGIPHAEHHPATLAFYLPSTYGSSSQIPGPAFPIEATAWVLPEEPGPVDLPELGGARTKAGQSHGITIPGPVEVQVAAPIELDLIDGARSVLLPVRFSAAPQPRGSAVPAQTLLLEVESLAATDGKPKAVDGYRPFLADQQAPLFEMETLLPRTAVPERQLLMPIRLTVTGRDADQFTRLAQQSDTSAKEPRLFSEFARTGEAPPSRQSAAAATFAESKAAELFRQAPGLGMESILLRIEFDPEKLRRWLEPVSIRPVRPTGSASFDQRGPAMNNAGGQPAESASPAPAGTMSQTPASSVSASLGIPVAGQSSSFLEPLPNAAGVTANESSLNSKEGSVLPDLLQLGDEAVSNIPIVNRGLSQSLSNPKTAIAPSLERAVLELTGSDICRVEFDRLQIESLLKRGEIRLRMHPPELGSIRIELVTTDDQVSARFEISSETAKRMVEQNLPQLRENLERAGVRIDQVEILVRQEAEEHRHPAYSQERPQWEQSKSAGEPETDVLTNRAQPAGVCAGRLNLLA